MGGEAIRAGGRRLRPFDDNRVLASVTLRMGSEGGSDSQELTNLDELAGSFRV